MTDQELRRMSRGELLELLLSQTAETERLKRELADAQAALRDRRIAVENAGSIAEASLQLNGVFEAAQAAAEQYLENLRQMSGQQEQIAQRMQEEARRQADHVIAEANEYSRKTRAEADDYWNQVSGKARALIQSHEDLRQLLQSGRKGT